MLSHVYYLYVASTAPYSTLSLSVNERILRTSLERRGLAYKSTAADFHRLIPPRVRKMTTDPPLESATGDFSVRVFSESSFDFYQRADGISGHARCQ